MSTSGWADKNNVLRRMRGDWNRRARSDARYYVALGRKNQTWQNFFDGASDLVRGLEREINRIANATNPRERRALEIGCGPGRLMLPLSRHFHEIHGVDVSGRMIRLAQKSLAGVAHAHAHTTDGVSLEQFSDESFDFVYSYAVFQHIPSRKVVLNYLEETRRVLRDGGVARMHFNGFGRNPGKCDTWSGVRFTADEIATFAREHDLRLSALEGVGTQYMWGTFVKRPVGWFKSVQQDGCGGAGLAIRRITSAESSSSAVPARGRYAAFALWVTGLSADADLNTLRIDVGGRNSQVTCIGAPQRDGLQQVMALLPPGITSGLQPVRLMWANKMVGAETFLRVVPPGPEVPRIVSLTDAVYPGSGRTISSNRIRVFLEESHKPADLRAALDGTPVRLSSFLCTIPNIPGFEVDFELPIRTTAGAKQFECWQGRRYLGRWEIVIDRERLWFLRGLQNRLVKFVHAF